MKKLSSKKVKNKKNSNNFLLHFFLLASFLVQKITSIAVDYTFPQDYKTAGSSFISNYLNNNFQFNNLLDHGCWCAYLDLNNDGTFIQGPDPVDALDEICRQWYLSRHCNDQLNGGSCYKNNNVELGTSEYKCSIDVDTFPKISQCYAVGSPTASDSIDQCEYDSCLTDQKFVSLIDNYISDNGGNINAIKVDATNSYLCASSSAINSNHKVKMCTGTAPDFLIQPVSLNGVALPIIDPISNTPQIPQIIPVTCSCKNGQPITDPAFCNLHTENDCVSCDPYFHLNSGNRCKKNSCVCENGQPNQSKCLVDNSNNCQSCDLGYHQTKINSNQYCEANNCDCENGQGATGINCPINGAEICASCDEFYSLKTINSNKICQKNNCVCTNGYPSKNCVIDNQERCKKCEDGFVLDSTSLTCYKPCECENGIVSSNPDPNHCECESCDTGYHLNAKSKKCKQNICSCENGFPKQGVDCTVNNANQCRLCDTLYGLDSNTDQCLLISCICDNGVPAKKGCTSLNQQRCKKCNSGYTRDKEYKCIADTDDTTTTTTTSSTESETQTSNDSIPCMCDNGIPAKKGCTATNPKRCRWCNDGYELSEAYLCFSQTLDPNQTITCSCDNGSPARKGCTIGSPVKCRNCITGYSLTSENKCEEDRNVIATGSSTVQNDNDDNNNDENNITTEDPNAEIFCTCKNGRAAKRGCTNASPNRCRSCDDEYELDDDYQCVALPIIPPDDPSTNKATAEQIKSQPANSQNQNTVSTGNAETTKVVATDPINGQPIAWTCLCENGTPSKTCTTRNENSCRSCLAGYHIGEDQKTCEQNVCQCENGVGASGISCTNENAEICEECDDNYFLKKGTCRRAKYTCLCENGKPATQTCTADDNYQCESCDQGYNLNNKRERCDPNRCKCSNGDPVDSEYCLVNEENNCKVCDDGFFLTVTERSELADGRTSLILRGLLNNFDSGNEIGLRNVLAEDLLTPEEEELLAARELRNLNAIGSCSMKQCQCPNGIGVKGNSCPDNQTTKCQSCNKGYQLNGNTCQANICNCNNGSPATGSNCQNPGMSICESCNFGYHLQNNGNNCAQNQCQCTAVTSCKNGYF